MNSSKIYSLALSGFVKHPSSGEQIFKIKYFKYDIYIYLRKCKIKHFIANTVPATLTFTG